MQSRFRELDAAFLIRSQDALEIEPDGSPEPDVAIVRFCSDYHAKQHPNGSDARLAIEIGDAERNPREQSVRLYARRQYSMQLADRHQRSLRVYESIWFTVDEQRKD